MEQVIDHRIITTIIINSTNRTNITEKVVIILLIIILFAAVAIIVVAGHLLGLGCNVVNIIIVLQCSLIIGFLFFTWTLTLIPPWIVRVSTAIDAVLFLIVIVAVAVFFAKVKVQVVFLQVSNSITKISCMWTST